jgi:hypothetical protein
VRSVREIIRPIPEFPSGVRARYERWSE